MRTIVVYDSSLTVPTAPPFPPGLADRPPAVPAFDEPPIATRDGGVTHLTFRLEGRLFDGSKVLPSAFVATVYEPENDNVLGSGRRDVIGPGLLSIPVDGLPEGAETRLQIVAEYPDLDKE